MRGDRRRRLLALAVVLTLGLLVVDLVGGPGPGLLRRGAATVLGPLERGLAPSGRAGEDELRRANERLAEELRRARLTEAETVELSRLLAAPATSGAELVPARVVGVGAPGPQGVVRVTIDVGSRDGVSVDRTVVASGGLVGRVASVAPWTSDVLVVGGPDVVVGARVGAAGALATVGGNPGGSGGPGGPGGPGDSGGTADLAPGELGLTLVQVGSLAVGDEVRTLGSVDGRPFVPGVLIGTVTAVEPSRGRLAPVGTVSPAVDTGSLSVVGVLLTAPRATPRPAVTGGAP